MRGHELDYGLKLTSLHLIQLLSTSLYPQNIILTLKIHSESLMYHYKSSFTNTGPPVVTTCSKPLAPLSFINFDPHCSFDLVKMNNEPHLWFNDHMKLPCHSSHSFSSLQNIVELVFFITSMMEAGYCFSSKFELCIWCMKLWLVVLWIMKYKIASFLQVYLVVWWILQDKISFFLQVD